jgi:hypothetical protein
MSVTTAARQYGLLSTALTLAFGFKRASPSIGAVIRSRVRAFMG